MDFAQLTIHMLMSISSFLHIKSIPISSQSAPWHIEHQWQQTPSGYHFKATSTDIIEQCKRSPNSYIEFPPIILGSHNIFLDDVLIFEFGKNSFAEYRSFYGAPVLACSHVANGTKLVWRAFSLSQYFARFSFFPKISHYKPLSNFFRETLNVIAAGFLLIMALVSFLIFWRKTDNTITISFTLANIFLAGYFLFSVPYFFGLELPLLTGQKLADSSIFFGVACFFNALRIRGLIKWSVFSVFLATIFCSVFIFFVADSGDSVQFATHLTFPMALILFFSMLYKQFKILRTNICSQKDIWQFLSLSFFIVSIINEMLMVLGVTDFYPILAIGTVGALVFTCLSINQDIVQTYVERDYLRKNLESEVERKTSELKSKTQELEQTMTDLKNTQAELVQTAKLASLGTLSAGIAHEINNSLNFVNGALKPLEKLITNSDLHMNLKAKNLLNSMSHGLKLTFEIMDSLRSYSGLNQPKLAKINLLELVNLVLVLVRNKLKNDIQVSTAIDENISIYGNSVGLSQVFMNLILNAIDAMPDGGSLNIAALSRNQLAEIIVSDSGCGMTKEIEERIFEPFFTTKEVGKGTGLGLHIVHQEIDRHGGRISVQSELGKGTKMCLVLPIFEEKVALTG